jgi:hypothetical protein
MRMAVAHTLLSSSAAALFIIDCMLHEEFDEDRSAAHPQALAADSLVSGLYS